MKKYRAPVCSDAPQVRPARKPVKRFDLGQLAQRYGLGDMVDFSHSDSLHDQHTVDEEFEAYTTATFEQGGDPDDDCILAFWEVSIPTTHYHSGLGFMLHRGMKPSSPHYTQLHSTIYLSRGQRFHVSAFSHRVEKRTQSGAIEFIPCSWRPCKSLSSL
jgi:hypothetical protein